MTSMRYVTPCVGVWIETRAEISFSLSCSVTPCVGVWIETPPDSVWVWDRWSHPAWVCGLKPLMYCKVLHSECHTLRGCVD